MEEKCQHKGEKGNFCSNCGIKIKERCSECGEMEPIERSICLTKAANVKGELKKIIQKKIWRADIISWLTAFFFFSLAFIPQIIYLMFFTDPNLNLNFYEFGKKTFFGFIQFRVWSSLSFFIGGFVIPTLLYFFLKKRNEKKVRKLRNKFLTDNPEFKEVLEKAREKH